MGRLDDISHFSITRLRGTARSEDVLDPLHYLATGFWVRSQEGKNVFVTNKHNVDTSLKPNLVKKGYQVESLEIEVRDVDEKSTSFYKVKNFLNSLWMHSTADCAILVEPDLEGISQEQLKKIFLLPEEWLANNDHFKRLQITDDVFFIGFPGFNGRQWFDQELKLPIGRGATLASIPTLPFVHQEIPTSDVIMVAGLSFSGSSGSPVINKRIGIPPGDIVDPSFVASQIIGIMSGHFSEPSPTQPEALRHGGLSYFTRSTAVHTLINEARSNGFNRL